MSVTSLQKSAGGLSFNAIALGCGLGSLCLIHFETTIVFSRTYSPWLLRNQFEA